MLHRSDIKAGRSYMFPLTGILVTIRDIDKKANNIWFLRRRDCYGFAADNLGYIDVADFAANAVICPNIPRDEAWIKCIIDCRVPDVGDYYITCTGENLYRKKYDTKLNSNGPGGSKRFIVDMELLYQIYPSNSVFRRSTGKTFKDERSKDKCRVKEAKVIEVKLEVESMSGNAVYNVPRLKVELEESMQDRLNVLGAKLEERENIIMNMAEALKYGRPYEGLRSVVNLTPEAAVRKHEMCLAELELLDAEVVCREDLAIDPLRLLLGDNDFADCVCEVTMRIGNEA